MSKKTIWKCSFCKSILILDPAGMFCPRHGHIKLEFAIREEKTNGNSR